jgi:pimeloyl-ACP methyl ester carboxylesterase
MRVAKFVAALVLVPLLFIGTDVSVRHSIRPAARPPAAAEPVMADSAACADVREFTCADLLVPLDRSGSVPGTLRLHVAIQSQADPARGTLLLLTGGPGQPGRGLLARLLPRFRFLLEHYRLVLIDQRGTGGGALDCPQAQRELGESDVVPLSPAAVTECASILGPARDFFTTADTVADLDDLRRALGVDRWTIDGISYGSFVAAQYGLAHPEHVDRIVLDSVVPLTGATTLYTESFAHVAEVVRAACRDQGCDFDPAADIERVLRGDVHPADLLNLLILASIIDPAFRGNGFYPVLQLIHRAAQGEVDPLRRAIAELRANPPNPEQYSAGLHLATICADQTDAPWGDSSAALDGREPTLLAATAKVAVDRVWPFRPEDTAQQGIAAFCRLWPPSRPNPRPSNQELVMPVLLIAGDRDLSTPLEWAREVAAKAPHSRLVVIPGAGHSLQGRNSEADRAVREFLL